MNCQDNLKQCNAECCRVLGFTVEQISEDLYQYYILHGCTVLKVFERKTHKPYSQILIPNVCPYLDEATNLCKIHDTELYPKTCRKFGDHTVKDYFVPEKCIFNKRK